MLEITVNYIRAGTKDYLANANARNIACSLLPSTIAEIAGTISNFFFTPDTLFQSMYDGKVLAATAVAGVAHPLYKCVVKPVGYRISDGWVNLTGR